VKKLFKLIRHWRSARVIIPADKLQVVDPAGDLVIFKKVPMRHPDSLPMAGRYCLVVYDADEISGDVSYGYWLWEGENDAFNSEHNFDRIKYFFQL